MLIMEASDRHGPNIIHLIRRVWREYGKGDPLCVMPELSQPASHYRSRGGCIWVVTEAPFVVGCVAALYAPERNSVELQKLYVDPLFRQQGFGDRLCCEVENYANNLTQLVELWSDVQLSAAHRLYSKRGYLEGGTRQDQDVVRQHYFKVIR